MNASYGIRLALQCLSSLFLVNFVLSLLVLGVAPLVVRLAEHLRPTHGARFLIGLRIFPFAAALYVALAISVPSYLRLEREFDAERVGIWAVALASAAVALLIESLVRAALAIYASHRFTGAMKRTAHFFRIGAQRICVTDELTPRIAVTGLVTPQCFISRTAVALFSKKELELVLSHEMAHQKSRDNLKRLLWLMLPNPIPFVSFDGKLDRAYRRLIEWAADDCAVAGDSQKSVCLASALVAFARTRTSGPASGLSTCLIEDTSDLAPRVERLLAPMPGWSRWTSMIPVVVGGAVLAVFAVMIRFADLAYVHRMLEALSQ